jgi:hypothetical protein
MNRASFAVCLLMLAMIRPLNAGLVGYWPFDGDVFDQSGLGNDGELLGATFVNSVPSVLGAGQALSFEDPTEHVLIPADASLNSKIFTLSMFVNDQGQFSAINRFTSRTSDTFETGIDMAFGTGSLSYYSPGNGWTTTGVVPDLDSWNHIAYVADGSNMTVYFDGEDVFGPTPFAAFPSGDMHIGNRWNDVEGFLGMMDDVALWDVALPASSIADLANGAKRPPQIPVPEPPPPPPTPFLTVGTNVDTWRLSSESIDGGSTGEWDPSADPPPPAINTFTAAPLATSPAEVGHIHAAAIGLEVQGIQADNDTHYYRTTFSLDRTSGFSTEIQLAVDNGAQLYINGDLVATETSFLVENWGFPLPSLSIETDGAVESTKFEDAVTSFSDWKLGENEVILAVRNPFEEASPAGGFAFRMDFFATSMLGDFDGNGTLDVADIDDLTAKSASLTNPPAYDLNGDQKVDSSDVMVWVSDLFGTWVGDANLDLEFNSSDLVIVLAAGAYEVNTDAVWSTGDFNGDGRANSSDLVFALADGGYEQGPRAAVSTVPEPSCLLLVATAWGVTRVRRRRRNVAVRDRERF